MNITHPENRLAYFPITMYSSVMGLTGLAIAYQKALHFFAFPRFVFFILLAVAFTVFLIITVLYSVKAWRYPEEVEKEFNHPVKLNFFAAFSISLLLQSIAFYAVIPFLGAALWFAGTIIHAALTFYAFSVWINRQFEITHKNPAWFIPIVGNILVPVVGVDLMPKEVSLYFFSVGFFFWIVLSSIVFFRLIFNNVLPEKFLPTLFIFIAPAAVGFIAYIRLSASFDMFAGFMLSIALFFSFLMLTMTGTFVKIKFFVSWWAFTFPLTALSIAFQLAYALTGSKVYAAVGLISLAVATAVVLLVSYKTVVQIHLKKICVEEN